MPMYGYERPLAKTDADPLAVPAGSPSELTLDTKVLDGYIGNYELFANFILTVTREGNQLFLQGTNQPRGAVYPKSSAELSNSIFLRDIR